MMSYSNMSPLLKRLLAASLLLTVAVPAASLAAQLSAGIPALSPDPQAGAAPAPPPGQAPVRTITLQDAVTMALKSNVNTMLAAERIQQARGQEAQSRAGLLPQAGGSASQLNQTRNLAALGLQPGTFPGMSSLFVGPFNTFDARVQLAQTVFNLGAIRRFQSGRAGVRVAGLQESLARQQVASGAALSYVEVLRADRAVESSIADLELARSLLTLAQSQHNAGVATGVDVTRAESRVASAQVQVARARTEAQQARFQLLRTIGIPLGTEVRLSDELRYADEPLPPVDVALASAEQDRPEVRIGQEEVNRARLESQAAVADQLPSLDVFGDYGLSGIRPNYIDLPTRTIGVRVNVPIFNGGLTFGRITEARSRLRQSEIQLGDIRTQVEEDVRLALQLLPTAAEQVRAANQSLQLAERELTMARDRFSAGVADNIEVITAQTALANARAAQVAALAQYNSARINLASALGRIESFRW